MSDNGLRNILFRVYSRLAGLPRPVSLGLMFVISLFWIAFLTLFLSKDSEAAKLLLGYSSDSLFPYPFTIQNLMYVFSGLAWVTWSRLKPLLHVPAVFPTAFASLQRTRFESLHRIP